MIVVVCGCTALLHDEKSKWRLARDWLQGRGTSLRSSELERRREADGQGGRPLVGGMTSLPSLSHHCLSARRSLHGRGRAYCHSLSHLISSDPSIFSDADTMIIAYPPSSKYPVTSNYHHTVVGSDVGVDVVVGCRRIARKRTPRQDSTSLLFPSAVNQTYMPWMP